MRVFVILPAAGLGTRMTPGHSPSPAPKQFLELRGVPILIHTLRAFAEAEADGFIGTDEASLVERAGTQVAVVQGSPANFKITQPGDLELAEFYLQHQAAQ